ncbi:MAG: hypothetical protein HXY52_01690 [Nitrospirae bacterium]|jgi:uncharacterized protein YydD (DUF2326 family)|nr:hypothetical protein [Nitrospirota bacterium]
MAELRKKSDLQNEIINCFTEIENLCEEGITQTKELATIDDTTNISDTADKIFEKIDEIRDLLFEIEETFEEYEE